MAFPPQAYIVGAQKAATTSLADILAQHPGIEVSNPKEPDFFNVNWERGLDWYRARFARIESVLLDASVSYTMAAAREWERGTEFEVPERIHSLNPDAKFIYIVRDPASRCYSAYWHERRAGREKKSLRSAVERKAYYTMASYYHLQITRFLRYFPLERFHIVRFDEAVREPLTVAQRCSDFIGAGHPEFSFTHERQKNQGFQYNFAGEALRGLSGISRFLPAALKPLAKKMLTKELPDLTPQDHAWMTERFREDALAFESLTGVRVLSESR